MKQYLLTAVVLIAGASVGVYVFAEIGGGYDAEQAHQYYDAACAENLGERWEWDEGLVGGNALTGGTHIGCDGPNEQHEYIHVGGSFLSLGGAIGTALLIGLAVFIVRSVKRVSDSTTG